jgi:hypothetical protein
VFESPFLGRNHQGSELVLTTSSIRVHRRSFPQTEQEAEFRYGISLRNRQLEEEEEEDKRNSTKVNGLDISFGSYVTDATNGFDHHRQVIINWEHLSEERVTNTLERSSVWNGGSGLFDIDQNLEELSKISALFTIPKMIDSNKRKSGVPEKESVLDQRRATTISVAMKRMRLQPNKFGKLAWALRDMNESYLTPSAVEILNKSCLWATPKEIEDMKARVREGNELADPDALLWFLAISVPDMSARIAALAFRYEFDDMNGEMIRATSLIKAASLEICASDLLKRVMRVILLIGNNINETYGSAPAVSFLSLQREVHSNKKNQIIVGNKYQKSE